MIFGLPHQHTEAYRTLANSPPDTFISEEKNVELEIWLFISPQSEYWKQSYISIFDVFSFLGGNYTSLSALFITLPSMIWFNRSYFKNYAIERIEQIENLNKDDSEKTLKRRRGEEVLLQSITHKYLQFVR